LSASVPISLILPRSTGDRSATLITARSASQRTDGSGSVNASMMATLASVESGAMSARACRIACRVPNGAAG
jgi:hypothetical protein